MRSSWYVASSVAFLCVPLCFFVAGVYILTKQPTMPAYQGKKVGSSSLQHVHVVSIPKIPSHWFPAARDASVAPSATATITRSSNTPVVKASATTGSSTKDTKDGSGNNATWLNNQTTNSPLFNTVVTGGFSLLCAIVGAGVGILVQLRQEKDNQRVIADLTTNNQTVIAGFTSIIDNYYQSLEELRRDTRQDVMRMQQNVESDHQNIHDLHQTHSTINQEMDKLRKELEALRQEVAHPHQGGDATSQRINGQASNTASQNANALTRPANGQASNTPSQNINAAFSESETSAAVQSLNERLKNLLEDNFTVPISVYPGININMPQDYHVTYLTPSKDAKFFQESDTGYKRDPNEIILDDRRVQETARSKGFSLAHDTNELNLHEKLWVSLDRPKHYYLIEGDCAITQTMLLKYLALKILKGQVRYALKANQTPVHLELPIYIDRITCEEMLTNAPENDLLTSFIAQKAQILKEQLSTSSNPLEVSVESIEVSLREYIKNERALLLLDGLNTQSYAAIANIIKKYPALPILITTTLAPPRVTLSEFERWKILPFSLEDIRKLSATAHPEVANAMLQRIEQYPRIASLITSQRLFEYVKKAYSNADSQKYTHIYEYMLCEDALLCHIVNNPPSSLKKLSHLLDKQPEKTVEFLLSCMAWHLHNTYGRSIEKKSIARYIVRALSSEAPMSENKREEVQGLVEEGIDTYMQQYGLLREVQSDSFSMASFSWQEYFAAKYILTHPNEEQTIFYRYHDPWWEEIILLYLSMANTAESLPNNERGKICQGRTMI